MEGGDLFHYLLDRQIEAVKASTECITAFQFALPEDEARHVFNQIVSALGYAHNQHICHRDLKLENILLKAKNLSCVKIADFGLSAFYRSALPALLRPSSLIFIPSSPGAHMKSSCGTLSFLAPEVFAGTSNAGQLLSHYPSPSLLPLPLTLRFSGPPLDVWALGVILFALLCGRLPFEGPDLAGTKRPREAVIRSRISKGQYKIEEGLSPEAKDLVRRMLRIDPSIRASVPEIFSHVWMRTISQNYDPHHSGIREKDVMSPLSLIQKLSLSSPTPAVPSPGPGTESRISTPRTSLKVTSTPLPSFLILSQLPNLVSTTPVGVEREEEVPVIELEDAITVQSSSETELDNLPTFEMERVITKLRSGSTDVSAEDAIETLISGRRSSSRSGRYSFAPPTRHPPLCYFPMPHSQLSSGS
jgi:serine/threonine protein kinase